MTSHALVPVNYITFILMAKQVVIGTSLAHKSKDKNTFLIGTREIKSWQSLIETKTSISLNKYLLLAEFSVRTVNYGPSFFPSIYGPSAKR